MDANALAELPLPWAAEGCGNLSEQIAVELAARGGGPAAPVPA
jgi:hypothetical protein